MSYDVKPQPVPLATAESVSREAPSFRSFSGLFRWLLGPWLAAMIWLLPMDLPPDAHRLAGLMAWIIAWWISEPIPLPATSLLGATLAALLGIAEPKVIFSSFGDPIIFLFLGGFLLAKAMETHGTDRRIAHLILSHPTVRTRPWRSIAAVITITGGLSMWLSNSATTVIMIPIALGVLQRVLPERRASHGVVVLSVAYAASMGGLATPVGTPPNVVAIGMLKRLAGVDVSFAQWMAIGVPMSLILISILLVLLKRALPELPDRQNDTIAGPRSAYAMALPGSKNEPELIDPLTPGQANSLFALMVAILLWLLPDLSALALGATNPIASWIKGHVTESVAALLAACLLFVLPAGGMLGHGEDTTGSHRPTLTWRQAATIDWGTLILFGGGLAFGSLIFETGLAAKVGGIFHAPSLSGETSFFLFLVIIVTVTLAFTEAASNTASANMLIPLVIAAARQSSLDPLFPVIATALACNLGFMMPVGTPPNAIAYGTGLVPVTLMYRKGFFLNGISVILIVGLIAAARWLVEG